MVNAPYSQSSENLKVCKGPLDVILVVFSLAAYFGLVLVIVYQPIAQENYWKALVLTGLLAGPIFLLPLMRFLPKEKSKR